MRLIKLKKVLPGYEEAYQKESLARNLNIFIPFSIAMAVIEIGILIFQYIRLGELLFTINYFYIYTIATVVSLVFYMIFRQYKIGRFKKNQEIIDLLFVVCFYILAIAVAKEELSTGVSQSIVLTIYTFFIASILHFSLITMWSLIITSNAFFVYTIITSNLSEELKYTDVLNCLFPLVMILAVTIPFTNSKIERFNQNIELEKANMILKRTNIKLKHLNRQLEETAATDALTGVLNRFAFNNAIDISWEHALITNEDISVIMLDVDYFKRYNDYYGHVEGDKCLKAIAGTMIDSLKRGRDKVYRYGGEEFIVLLPGVGVDGATIVAERILKRVEALKIPHEDGGGVVTISAGIHSMIPLGIDNKAELVDKADQALYYAKKNGRRQYVVYNNIKD